MSTQSQMDPSMGTSVPVTPTYPYQYGAQGPPGYNPQVYSQGYSFPGYPNQTPTTTYPTNYAPGYSQPYPPGYSQPYAPGYSQPYPQGYSQPYAPGYSQPYPPGYTYPQGYTQPYPPGYTQSYPPGYTQPYPPGYTQPYPPGYTQPYPPGYPHPNTQAYSSTQGYPQNTQEPIQSLGSGLLQDNQKIYSQGISETKREIPKYPPGLPIPGITHPISLVNSVIPIKELEKQEAKHEKTSRDLLLEILSPKSQIKSEPNSTTSLTSNASFKSNGFKSPNSYNSYNSNNNSPWVRGHSPSTIQNLKLRRPERKKEQPIDVNSPKTNFEIMGNRASLSQNIRNIVNNIELFYPKTKCIELNKQELLDTITQGDEFFEKKEWISAANIHRGLLEKLKLAKIQNIDYESEKDWSSHISHHGKVYIGSKTIPRWPVNNLADFMNIHPEIYQYIGLEINYTRLKRYKAFVIDNQPYKDFAQKHFPIDYEKHQQKIKNKTNEYQEMYETISENTDDDLAGYTTDEFFKEGDICVPGQVLMPNSKVKYHNRYNILDESEESLSKDLSGQTNLDDFGSLINFNSNSKFESKIDRIIDKIKSIKSNVQAIGLSIEIPSPNYQACCQNVSEFVTEPTRENHILSNYAIGFKKEFKNMLGIELDIDSKMFKYMIQTDDEDLESFVSSRQEDFTKLYNTFNPTESLFSESIHTRVPDSNWNNKVKKPLSF